MKKARFTESQIVAILKEADAGGAEFSVVWQYLTTGGFA